MNRYQRAYALAKAHHQVTVDLYNQEFRNHEEYQALTAELDPLLDSVEGTPEYARALEIDKRMRAIEREIDETTAYRRSGQVLRQAEEAMVQWSFDVLKNRPAAFAKFGIRYSDIEVLLPHMANPYSPIRRKLIDLSFRFAG